MVQKHKYLSTYKWDISSEDIRRRAIEAVGVARIKEVAGRNGRGFSCKYDWIRII